MAIKQIQFGQAGLTSSGLPNWLYIDTNDTIATVTTSGYLNSVNSENPGALSNRSMALVITRTSIGVGVPPVLYLLQVTNTSGVWSLSAPAVDVPVPFIVGGNIQAGSSGVPGYFISYPSAASKGSFQFVGVANTGNTTTVFSNAAMGQASTIIIPDPANAAGQLLIGATATPFVSGNLPQASGTGGLMADSGIVASTVMKTTAVNTMSGSGQITLVKTNGTESGNAVTASGTAGIITTSSLTTAAAGTYAITWTNTKITATSIISLTVQGGTNTTQNITFTVVPGTGTATLTIYNNTSATSLNGTIFIGYTVF